jgi:ketosteroid isomerase-like protein
MTNLSKLVLLAASFGVLAAACAKTAAPDTAGDEVAARAVNVAWYKAYNAGDGAAVAALYAEDAVLNAPGAPAARGMAPIRDYYLKNAADTAAAGLALVDDPSSDVGVSGDLAWQSGTFKITDKSGAVVDAGKYITVFQRKNGKWMIIRDTWNSDTPPASK